jgi:protein-S-isoprenylcysteine O-methyltransferase Ste14
MKATSWEFANRAMIFGMIIGVPFGLYTLDHENATAILADWLGAQGHLNADRLAQVLFAIAGLLVAAAALIRTWASSYLNAGVVYASSVKTAFLVADGPYRRTRNPLYFANILMAIAMGSMMSRSGDVLCVAAMMVFCYRLIFREEDELHASQGERYDAYRRAVPRLWPALRLRVRSTARPPAWTAGFKAEAWYWGFAAALLAFAVTLRLPVFCVVMSASVGLFWISSAMLEKK